MKYYIILIVAFLQCTLSNSSTVGTSSNISSLQWKTASKIHCKNFKCPPVEDPLCVRIKAKTQGSKTKVFHMVLFNKCELEYIKCRQGYHATLLPMKNCGHHDKLTGKGKVRPKRSLRQGLKKIVAKDSDSKSVESEKTDDQGTDKASAQKDNKYVDNEIEITFFSEVEKDTDYKQSEVEKDTDYKLSDVEKDTHSKQSEEEKDTHSKQREEGKDTNGKQSEVEKDTGYKHSEVEKDTDYKQSEVEKDTHSKQSEEEKDTYSKQREEEKDTDGKQSEVEKDTGYKHSEVEKDTHSKQSEEEKDTDAKQSEVNKDADSKQSEVEKDTNYSQSEAKKDTKNKYKDTKINKNESEVKKYYDSTTSGEEEDKAKKSLIKQKKNYSLTDMEKDQLYLHNVQKETMGYLVDYDLKATNEEVDIEEYNKDCPSICPAREVMICARCKDGVYRTFMSICHLRMFNCAHGQERAELVSRYPCILSAPYLAEAPTPKGRLSEPDDVDRVLQFIRCREKLELKRGDPICVNILQGKED